MRRARTVAVGRPTEHPKRKAGSARESVPAKVVDFDRYLPTVISRLMTRLRSSAQTYFDQRHGITRLDWRIISFIAAEGPSSAYDVWTFGNLDKAAVSRALKILEERGLVKITSVPGNARRRTLISLTREGRQVNDQTFTEIIKRHGRLVGDLTPAQIEAFIKTARYLEERIAFMDKVEQEPVSTFDVTRVPNRKKGTAATSSDRRPKPRKA